MTSHVFYKQAKVPVIRKLFRKAGYFICGICRGEHPSREEANNCLNQCWYQLKVQYPLIVKDDQQKGRLFRCQYCFREYRTEDAGLSCAQLCTENHERYHIFEQLTNDLPIDSRPRRKFRLVRLIPAEAPIADPAVTAASEPDSSIQDVEEPVVDLEEPDNEEGHTVDPALVKKHKKEFNDHWFRDGAKYKCRYCQEQFYTKIEVEACFESHFDAEGYELNPAGEG